jgi:hypothetical protein
LCSSSFPLGLRGAVAIRVWAIRCKECGRWFYLCKGCFHGQCYCSETCRRIARRRQCRAAQATYLDKHKGKVARASASAAFRQRCKRGLLPRTITVRNRSSCLTRAGFEAQQLLREARCEGCGRRGPVRQWR